MVGFIREEGEPWDYPRFFLLVADFVRVLRGEEPFISSTSLEKSIYGHQIGFAGEQSRLEGRTVPIGALNGGGGRLRN